MYIGPGPNAVVTLLLFQRTCFEMCLILISVICLFGGIGTWGKMLRSRNTAMVLMNGKLMATTWPFWVPYAIGQHAKKRIP